VEGCGYGNGVDLAATLNGQAHGDGFVWRGGVGLGLTLLTGSCILEAPNGSFGLAGLVARTSVAWPVSPHVESALEVRAGYELGGGDFGYVPGLVLIGFNFVGGRR